MMVLKNILYGLLLSAVVLMPSAYAGKVELTTYYPAPDGAYSSLNATSSLIPPRMTQDQINAIDATSNPPLAQGMVILNTDTNQLEVYSGTAWVSAGGGEWAQIVTAAGFTGFDTGSTAWVDVVSMTRTFPGGNIFALFKGQFYKMIGTEDAWVRLLVDEAEQDIQFVGASGSIRDNNTIALSWAGNLSGSKTIQVQCRVSAASNSVEVQGGEPRLTVIY